MDIVKQERVGDCGPACLAMVLGCTLVKARDALPKHAHGSVMTRDILEVLWENGVPSVESLEWPGNVPAILTVPSLNHPGLLHFIVWDGEQYLDPTHESMRYPDDAPIMHGHRLPPQWATAILLWPVPSGA